MAPRKAVSFAPISGVDPAGGNSVRSKARADSSPAYKGANGAPISDRKLKQLVADVVRRARVSEEVALVMLKWNAFSADQAVALWQKKPQVPTYGKASSFEEARQRSKAMQRDNLVADFVGITGLEPAQAQELLEAGDWDIFNITETWLNTAVLDKAQEEDGKVEDSGLGDPNETCEANQDDEEADDDPWVEVEVAEEDADAAIAKLTRLTGLREQEVEFYLQAANWDMKFAIELWSYQPHGPRIEKGEINIIERHGRTIIIENKSKEKDEKMAPVNVSDGEAEACIAKLVHMTGLTPVEAEQYLIAGDWNVNTAAYLFFKRSQNQHPTRNRRSFESHPSDTSSDTSSTSEDDSDTDMNDRPAIPPAIPRITVGMWPPTPGESDPYNDDFRPGSSTPPRHSTKRRRSEEDDHEAEIERQQRDHRHNQQTQDELLAHRHQVARRATRNFFVNNPLVKNPVSQFLGSKPYKGFVWCCAQMVDAADRREEYDREQWRLSDVRRQELQAAAQRRRQPNSFTVPASDDEEEEERGNGEWVQPNSFTVPDSEDDE